MGNGVTETRNYHSRPQPTRIAPFRAVSKSEEKMASRPSPRGGRGAGPDLYPFRKMQMDFRQCLIQDLRGLGLTPAARGG